MMKYNITIKDNETGETIIVHDADCIVGGLSLEGNNNASIALTACNVKNIVSCICSADEAKEELLKTNSIVAKLYYGYKMFKTMNEVSSNEDVQD